MQRAIFQQRFQVLFLKTIVKTVTDAKSLETISREAGALLARGEVVGFPTETVYGLGASAFCEEAIKDVFAAKGRPQDNPLIVHIASVDTLFEVASSVPESARRLAEAYWPGPLTMVLPKSTRIPDCVSAGLDTVGVRFPSHLVAQRIIAASGVPIAAPSANTSGRPSPTKAQHVFEDMDGKIPLIVDGGECSVGVESTVIDMTSTPPRLLRPGGVTLEQLRAVLGEVAVDEAVLGKLKPGAKPRAPGMKYRHYAPKAPVIVYSGRPVACAAAMAADAQPGDGVLCFDEFLPFFPFETSLSFGPAQDDTAHAQALFDMLRRFDTLCPARILAQCPDERGVGLAVVNRLKKAAGFTVIPAPDIRVIGLTGRSGSGKSTAARCFAALGGAVFNADDIYHRLTHTSAPLREELTARFGSVYRGDALDRPALAAVVFADAQALADLNAITHKYVLRETLRGIAQAAKEGTPFCVIDAPQLFESGAEALCDSVIALAAAPERLLARLKTRDALDDARIRARLASQPDFDFYRAHCDIVIENNEGVEELERRLACAAETLGLLPSQQKKGN